ncbi:hypothetical protein U9M48_010169 [Paspalum notatum var. saurae]|uniref:E2 ubiquitin-conjugating enzyme n=2 Tax=Magnoliopsida TaxID=3398 RepID=A0AAQ3SSZ1_PASNO
MQGKQKAGTGKSRRPLFSPCWRCRPTTNTTAAAAPPAHARADTFPLPSHPRFCLPRESSGRPLGARRPAMTSPSSSSTPSRKALSKIACNRLQKELGEWQVNPPAGFKHRVTDNLQRCPSLPPSLVALTTPFLAKQSLRWVIDVAGAPGTLYTGETYQLQVDFPEHYPMEAPQVIFLHPAPMHPHIYSNGHICLDILYDSWSPAMTVISVCISILSMLSSSPAKQRPADNDRYVRNCRNGRSPKETRWWFHDDKV